ncbi:hypothetical protein NDR87_16130 [Nocardia sp. CDC159]|uniref:Uncharacterized protein n=1 Tax=Nocardia pulmonis TaxID=2951408 RepID=A0A9X2EBZ2_9NOCA|nr:MULTISPECIES: hypothetical protein [Nocardia]MCM6775378.1 hypothetical protein [Nocardia pulmonis]MCM6787888.1 hypothetical protein [Nocardia sp. CDC159]
MYIVERAGQLTAEERERLNAEAGRMMQSRMNAASGSGGPGGGLAGLLGGLGMQSGEPQPEQIAAETAKEFGRTRNIQIAGMVAGQAVSTIGAAGGGDLAGLLSSLGSIGTMTVVNGAATAAVLGDLVGRGRFTQDVFDALMRPWSTALS